MKIRLYLLITDDDCWHGNTTVHVHYSNKARYEALVGWLERAEGEECVPLPRGWTPERGAKTKARKIAAAKTQVAASDFAKAEDALGEVMDLTNLRWQFHDRDVDTDLAEIVGPDVPANTVPLLRPDQITSHVADGGAS